MAEEEVTTAVAAAAAETSVTMTEQIPGPKLGETVETQASIEATVKSATQGGIESTCNNTNNAESFGLATDVDAEKTLEFADELTEKGSKAFSENDFAEAADCFSRALEIRAAHHGELSIECLKAYYLYGRALLCKAQEETDPLLSVPKKESETQQESTKSAVIRESSVASVSSNSEQDGGGEDNEEESSDDSDSGTDDNVAEAKEEEMDESDLDFAWKMLDVARAIAEKQQLGDTMEKVDILSALAEVALESEDIESSLGDYQKALSILQRMVEPDHRQIAELNFRICICLEIGSKPKEAIPYCQKAISVCKSRLQQLKNEVEISSGSALSSAASELGDGVQNASSGSQIVESVRDKEAEIKTLTGLADELEKKLEDLQQLTSDPKSVIAEILGIARGGVLGWPSDSNGSFDPQTVSTAHTNGASVITHLGVVGRGVKRVLMSTSAIDLSQTKKPAFGPSSDKGDGSSAT